ncbi:hypothetical protein [Granulicoccus sp. GXG6511]|uniref:hypothetical protein n=1 Tax=Granulicoccus sp. GXG6511 TaxID=3381351 RepID=UPI003D7DDADB
MIQTAHTAAHTTTTTSVPTRRPFPTLLLAASGAALFGYIALRPWSEGDTPAAWSQILWPVSHLLAVAGFVLYAALGGSVATRKGRVLGWLSVGLLVPYYGAEAFGLHVLGSLRVEQAAAIAQAFRYGPLPMITFAGGWIALGWLAVLVARAVRTPDRIGRAALAVHSVAMCAWLPVFFLPPAGRVAHAVIVLIAALVAAARLSGKHR